MAPFARHFFTSRAWSLGSGAADDGKWAEVARSVETDPPRLLRAHQVHGVAHVAHHPGQPVRPPGDADIVMSGDRRVAVAVQTADCVPVLLVDTRTGAVAAVHAGWRGLVQRAPVTAVEAMETEFGTRASKLVVAVGGAIGPCCYEVGPEVADRFAAAGFPEWERERWFSPEPRVSDVNPSMPGVRRGSRDGHSFLDLWTLTYDQLRAAGVREDRIFVARLCTASHPDVFCSYRRDGVHAGRMAAVIRGNSTL
jgi:YfiH family protein